MAVQLLTAEHLDIIQAEIALRHGWAVGGRPGKDGRALAAGVVANAARAFEQHELHDATGAALRYAKLIAVVQPYRSGNLAVAVMALVVTIGRNGLELNLTPGEVISLVRALARRDVADSRAEAFVRRHIHARKGASRAS